MKLIRFSWVIVVLFASCNFQPEVYPGNEEAMKNEAEEIFMLENQIDFVLRETYFMLSAEFSKSGNSGDDGNKYRSCGATIDSLELKKGVISMEFNQNQLCGSTRFSRSGKLQIKSSKSHLRNWYNPDEEFEVTLENFTLWRNGLKVVELDGKIKFLNSTPRILEATNINRSVLKVRGQLSITNQNGNKKDIGLFRKFMFNRQSSLSNQMSSWLEVVADTTWRGKEVFITVLNDGKVKTIGTVEDTLKYNFCSMVWKKSGGLCHYYDNNDSDESLFRIRYGLDVTGTPTKQHCLSNAFSINWKTGRAQYRTLILEYKD
ncbi:MAG: hypothetical protein SNJ77_07665 [Cytophagales bacterium]